MIFCRTKRAADRAAEDLDFRGFAVAAVHGDLGQGARERALRAFRNGKIDVLVATDVAARGLDVSGVTHVINYDCPEDPDTYTHRIGRTGRAGATGVAVTFVDWEDMPRWRIIDKTLGLDMPEPPETYHTSPHLFADLDIDPSVTGTLPTAGRTRAGLGAEVEEDLGSVGRPRRGGPGGPGERAGRGSAGRGSRPRATVARPGTRSGPRRRGPAAVPGGPCRPTASRPTPVESVSTEDSTVRRGRSAPRATPRRRTERPAPSRHDGRAGRDAPASPAPSSAAQAQPPMAPSRPARPRRRRRRGGAGSADGAGDE